MTALDTRGPTRFLWSVLVRRKGLLAASVLTGALWMLPSALMPIAIGNAIDAGIRPGDGGALLGWLLAVIGLGLVQTASSSGLSWTADTLWFRGASDTQRVALDHVARLGATLTRRTRAGEVVAISSSDIYQVANLCGVVGRAAGSLVAFLAAAVAVLLLSPVLGLVVLIGVPLATLGIGPLLAPLRRREDAQRERLTDLSALASDIVSGLRILRGVGGESRFHRRFTEASQQVRAAGVAAGRVASWLAAAEILLPGLVTVLVTWLGARLALSGSISVGELVAFYGVSAYLVVPVRTASEAAYTYAGAQVAARHVCTLLAIRPEIEPPANPKPLPAGALSLSDETSGLEIEAGVLTVIDAGADGEALAERLSLHRRDGRVLAGGVALDEADPAEVRRRILLAHNQDLLFSGPLRAELDLGSAVDVDTALHAADAHDVVEALPADAMLDERARSLSGGQRQRLLLARALCADADVLVLDEPTSAVDAHTEARIVRRVRDLRAGRTTVVLSQSPLWSKAADRTVVLGGIR
ncbi:ABC transporter ATP-binding protein [Saccharopolyspora taberi]|uniref:ABC transporter ATP-binding protein n=1 Tax=Saccharopolyspora taberi TaxID=60895 RepID=A0ABN3VLJ4_9PSEU